ncbi:MAG TPA: hypothetical protein VF557_20295 [Jatrophihabitans sp.]|jgi:hypothetical protein|uniref:hypothetical protein n=1 Tax=Jatrophihabitans sp. TaxID=1932789 RepID=UPI002F06CD2A
MRLRTTVVTALSLCLVATGCAGAQTARSGASGSPQAASGAPSSAAPDYEAQYRAGRADAESAARKLLALAEVPPGSVELATAPAALSGPALGSTVAPTNVDLARYWRVPLSFPALDAYVKQHPPAGLSQSGNMSRGSGTPYTTLGYSWHGAGGSSSNGELHIGLAAIGDASAAGKASYLRVDALTSWLDPRPRPDKAVGARMRIEAGDRCPAENKDMVGVRNEGKDLDHNLAPADKPNAGLLCSYAGMYGDALALSLERVLTAADAARIAEAAHRVSLSHYDALHTSLGMRDRSVTVLVLQYPNRPAVNLWLPSTSRSVTSNGHIVATDLLSLGKLRDVVNQLSR